MPPYEPTIEELQKESPLANEPWFKGKWRPAMAWLYMLICACDFIIFPVFSMWMPIWVDGMKYVPWVPITLASSGLIHLSFGAILGIAAWTRGAYEKPERAALEASKFTPTGGRMRRSPP